MFKALPLFFSLSSAIFAKVVSIELANDSSLSGELVKTGPNEVFIDLGFDIIKVPSSSIVQMADQEAKKTICLLYTSPSPRDATLSRMPSSA